MEHLFRDSPPYPLEVAGANGNRLRTTGGREYLDFAMGWCVGNAGWNNKAIMRAIKSFNGPAYVSPSYKYRRWEELAKKLSSLMPGGRGACFRATGGTEAVELALKIARASNRRKKFIAFNDAYHGQSLACMGLVGLHEEKFGPYPKDYIRLAAGDWEKTTAAAVKAIKSREVCAFISEPIICNLGVIVPPESFFQEVAEACRATDTLMIMDEVATGFGRTGKWFAFEHYGLEPDIVTIGKAFSSGYAPIGAAIASPAAAESMRFDFSNYSTFGWHPLAVECALANIKFMERNRLVEKSKKGGERLARRLAEFCEPEGKGLCIGFGAGKGGLQGKCLRDGLVIASTTSPRGDRAMLFPALDVGEKEMDAAVRIIKKHYRP